MIVILALCLASCVEVVVCQREELCSSSLYLPNPQWRFHVWEVLCGRIVEILLCEGGDVEQ